MSQPNDDLPVRAIRTLAVFSCVIVVSGCGVEPQPADHAPAETPSAGLILQAPASPSRAPLEAVVDLRLGRMEGAGPEIFGRIGGIEVDDHGTIFVLDAINHEVRVFGANGEFRHRFGRKGEGPGEFLSLDGGTFDSQGDLWVRDLNNRRYSRFSPDGEFQSSQPLPASIGIVLTWRGVWLESGELLDWHINYPERGERSMGTVLNLTPVKVSFPGGAVDSFPTWPQPLDVVGGRYPRPFGSRFLHTVHREGYVWTANSGEYVLARRSLSGDTTVLVSVGGGRPLPVTDQERDSIAEKLARVPSEGLSLDDVSTVRPVIAQMTVTQDGRLAVFPVLEEFGVGRVLDLFSPDGEWLKRVLLPHRMNARPVPVISGGFLYGVSSDSLGVERVMRFVLPG